MISEEAVPDVDVSPDADAAVAAVEGLDVVDFDTFVRMRSATLLRRAFLLTGDRHLAEDLLQTALGKVALRWPAIIANGDPMPYVRTVVVRTAIGWRRRHWTGELPTAPMPEAAHGDGVEVVDRRERLRQALLTVPPRQRAALVLRYFDDLTEVQIAQTLGCSIGTVKSQTAKGLARLRQVLSVDTFAEQGDDR